MAAPDVITRTCRHPRRRRRYKATPTRYCGVHRVRWCTRCDTTLRETWSEAG